MNSRLGKIFRLKMKFYFFTSLDVSFERFGLDGIRKSIGPEGRLADVFLANV